MFQVQSTLAYVFWVIAIIAFVFEVWALIDAVRTPAPAYEAAGKQTKQIWLIILGIANVVGLGGAANFLTILSLLPIAAFIAAAIYLADVRPAVKQFRNRRGGSSNTGPYGPW
ncbi:DUF2516 family protein [Actinomadura scrupuli]|uniref:DUF2516 family protein n=1 Tax=Actinomadura scrupuli TaxID=559629 RepID=UPI003D9981E1